MSARTGTLRRSGLTACLVVLGLVGAGCSDADEPGTLPKTKSPTASSASSSPTATTPERQVEAAVRTYYAELTKAAQTNDTSELKTLVDPNCPCQQTLDVIDTGAAMGERSPDAAWRLKSVNVHDVIGKTAAAEVRYDVTAYDVVDSSGKVLTHIKAQSSHLDLSLIEAPGGWVISNVFDLEG